MNISNSKDSQPQSSPSVSLYSESSNYKIEHGDELDAARMAPENFPVAIPAYTNLYTPPVSPSISTPETYFAKELNKISDLPKLLAFYQIRQSLINLLDGYGRELPKNLRLRLMECYSITKLDINAENPDLWNIDESISKMKTYNEKLEILIQGLRF